MKFLADVMLGTLAKSMRFSGYDVEYDNAADDETLEKRSRYRMLLTKDRALAARICQDRVYLVRTEGAERQLEEIQEKFPGKSATPRCMECNGKLSRIRKEKIQHLVPPFVFQQHSLFFHCGKCTRIYWTGTHYEKMMRMLK